MSTSPRETPEPRPDETIRIEPPPEETGSVPVATYETQPRWFGVAPAGLLLVLVAALVILAIVFFATGAWPYGLIAGGAAGLLLVAFLEVAQRRPDGPVAERSADAARSMREHARALFEAVTIRGRAQRRATALRLELRRLDARRSTLVAAFGDAVYRGADEGVLRSQLEELDVRRRDLHAELYALVTNAREEVANAKLAVQQTQMVSIPEPYPPPDEGTPPVPEPMPEPYPPPDEGTPPQPDPGPDDRG